MATAKTPKEKPAAMTAKPKTVKTPKAAKEVTATPSSILSGKKAFSYSALEKITPHTSLTKFEVETFSTTTGYDFPRFVVDTVNKIREIDQCSKEHKSNPHLVKKLSAEKEIYLDKLNQYDQDKLELSVSNLEQFELNYWINLLGKRGALEILSVGKISNETMEKLVKLPEDAYIKSVQICVNLANTIKSMTRTAEESIGIFESEQQ